jgi:hypothetical protein
MLSLWSIIFLLFSCNKTIQDTHNLTPGLWGSRVEESAFGVVDINSDVYFYVELVDEHNAIGSLFHVNGHMEIGGSTVRQCIAEEFHTTYITTNKGIELDCINENTDDICISATLTDETAEINIIVWGIYTFDIDLNEYTYVDDNFMLDICHEFKESFLPASENNIPIIIRRPPIQQKPFIQIINNMKKSWNLSPAERKSYYECIDDSNFPI